MSNTMEYKGYIGNIEFSEADSIFYGKVQGIRSLISYEGENAKDLLNDFHMYDKIHKVVRFWSKFINYACPIFQVQKLQLNLCKYIY